MYGVAPARPEFWVHLAQSMVLTLAVLGGEEVRRLRHELRNVWSVLLELQQGGYTHDELQQYARRVVAAHAELSSMLGQLVPGT